MIGISLLVGSLIHFPELLSLTDAWGNKRMFQHLSPVEVLVEIAYAAGSFWLLFLINLRFFRFNDPTIRMRWWTLGLSFCVTWLLSKLLGELFVFLHHEWGIPAIHSRIHLYLHPIRDLVIILIVNGTCYIYYLIRAHQAMVVQNSALQAENSRNQYLALKNQLNPHMLFNSLNTLQSLVREQPDKAEDYISYFAMEKGFGIQTRQDVYSSDSTPFADAGVPAISFARIAPNNTATIHNSYDTLAVMSGRQMVEDIAFLIAFTDRMVNAARCPVERTIPENMKEKLDIYLNRKRAPQK